MTSGRKENQIGRAEECWKTKDVNGIEFQPKFKGHRLLLEENEGFVHRTISNGARPLLRSPVQTVGKKVRKFGQINNSERIKKLAMTRSIMNIDKGEVVKSFIQDSNIENYNRLILKKA